MPMLLVATVAVLLAQGAVESKRQNLTKPSIESTATPSPWLMTKNPLSTEISTKSATGAVMTISCVRTSKGSVARQLFLTDVKASRRFSGSRLAMVIDGKKMEFESDAVDGGVTLSDAITDGMTVMSKRALKQIASATQINVMPSERGQLVVFNLILARSSWDNFAEACRSVKS